MPALQSPWFAPHVIVYMFAYAVLGAAFVVAVYLLWKQKTVDSTSMGMCDNLVYVGEAFLTIGMLFGAIWAKEAFILWILSTTKPLTKKYISIKMTAKWTISI